MFTAGIFTFPRTRDSLLREFAEPRSEKKIIWNQMKKRKVVDLGSNAPVCSLVYLV